MIDLDIAFANHSVDRCTALRGDDAALRRAFEGKDARALPLWQQQCLISGPRASRLRPADIGLTGNDVGRAILLGQHNGEHLFALSVTQAEAEHLGIDRFAELRAVMANLDAADAALLAYARAMLHWHQRHVHCGVCGSPNRSGAAGFLMICNSPACGHRSFPRLDPAIIVLVHRGDHCLLGRQASWPEGRYSTIAGFVEPGESLEECLQREVREETNIEVDAVRYLGSQPWPFPAALMIGFHAEAVSAAIHLNDGELAEAGWFTREQIAASVVSLPPRTSIAFRLIETWFDQGQGANLAELDLSGPPLRILRDSGRK